MSRHSKHSSKSARSSALYVNLNGEPLDVRTLRRLGAPRAPDEFAAAEVEVEAVAPAVESSAAELDAVFDALCLAGGPRGKTWVLHFLRFAECRSARGVYFTVDEVDAALKALRAQGRVVDSPHSGPEVPAAQRLARLPELLASDIGANAWKAWARASATTNQNAPETPLPSYRQPSEPVALARLVLFSGMGREAFAQAAQRVLGQAAYPGVLAEAVVMPFMPALFERMDDGLRQHLLAIFAASFDLGTPAWQPLMAWVRQRLVTAPASLPASLRTALAERCLHRGDRVGCDAALDGLRGPSVDLLRAAQQAWAGHWAAASADFSTASKDLAKASGRRRELGSLDLRRWYVLSLMAQPDPAAWTTAR